LSIKIFEAVGVALEMTGTTLSDAAIEAFSRILSGYPEGQVLAALSLCCAEVKGRLTLADVIGRIDDGRPGVEEAWSMIPRDEAGSVYWTHEMQKAYGAAILLLEANDAVAARMAFKEVYLAEVAKSRAVKAPPEWKFSLGTDHSGRIAAVKIAQDRGRLSSDLAAKKMYALGVIGGPEIKYSELVKLA
jgi:hypothetical protein